MQKLLLIFTLSTLALAMKAQNNAPQPTACMDSLVSSISTTTFYAEMDVHFSENYIVLKRKHNQYFVKNEAMSNLLSRMDKSTFKAYEISTHGSRIFALSCNRTDVSELAASYTTWVLIDWEYNKIVDYTTLSPNPKLIYYNKQGVLQFFRITYGTAYYWTRDAENVDYLIDHSQVVDGKPMRVDLKTSLCK